MTEATFFMIMTGILIAGFIVFLWASHCNSKTLKQRLAIIDSWPKGYGQHEEFLLAVKSSERVSYDQHFWALMTFRDPRLLYDRHTWNNMGWDIPQ